MAVGSFLKTSGIAALVLAVALPSAAFAQERGRWGGPGDGGQQAQQQQGGGQQGGGWQRGGGDGNRGGGWQGRSNSSGGNFQPRAAAPQVQAPAQPQAQPRWQGNGSGDGARSWRRDNAQPDRPQQNAQRERWNGGNRGSALVDSQIRPERRQQAQRNWNNNDGRRWDNDRNRADNNNRRWDNDRRGNWNGGNRWSGNNQRWNNNWRNDNRYNWFSYRNSNRNLFRMDRYYSPYRNWSYRRLSIGFMLEPLFYSSSYWIDDPYQYRLPPAYGPYRWVRYYDDALLVDTYTGEVVDVINDFFW